jgi:hypothetical protein
MGAGMGKERRYDAMGGDDCHVLTTSPSLRFVVLTSWLSVVVMAEKGSVQG